MLQMNYVGEGVKSPLKEEGTSGRAAVKKAFKSLGGTLAAFYYALGETDAYIIAELPDDPRMAVWTF